ncbi:hypothetical protein [Planomonospora venezuelensis]|uniref:Lipoprotein n=1 Tax=Planomonospora venezuelensis TaxID=1999 RepID=A0A841D8V1_PLAVE|nr:hypothetical protein [Planomonospora venezuelensis]MBB5966380.1 hypothetical protein [Planomonospora venezuelensis]GIN02794.1 hypothetical protein Pve01_44520 [Planomonospora venezuelensis]
MRRRPPALPATLPAALAAGLLAAASLAGCVSPAWDGRDYGLKAAASAESVASAVAVARRAVEGGDRLSTPYLKVLLTEAVTSVRSVNGQFAGVQPPDEGSDAVGEELLVLTGRAEDELAGLLLQVRRQGVEDRAGAVRELAALHEELRGFAEEHR